MKWVVVCLLGLVLAPLGCQRKVEEGITTIRFWSRSKPEERVLFARAAQAFEQANPGVRVKLEFSSMDASKILTAMQSGQCGDVLLLHWKMIPTFAAKGCLMRVDERAGQDQYDLADFFASSLNAYRYHESLYALPFQGSTMVLFYNKDLFDNAGLAYPTADWTWDDFLSAAQRLTRVEPSGHMTQVGCLPYDPASWVWSAGGDYISDDCSVSYFTNEATLNGLRFYAGLRNQWRVTTRNMNMIGADPMAVDVFERGHVGMDISGPWKLLTYMNASSSRGLRWDVALMPKGPAGRQTRYAGNGIAVWTDSPRREAAWKFAKFLCGPVGMRIFAEGWADMPTRRSLAYDVFAKQDCDFNIEVLLQSQEPAWSTVRVFPRTADWPEILRLFTAEYEQAMLGRKSVEEAMAATDAKVRRYLTEEAAVAGPLDHVLLAGLICAVLGTAAWRLRRQDGGRPAGKGKTRS